MPNRIGIALWIVIGLLFCAPAQTQAPTEAPRPEGSPDRNAASLPSYEEQYSEEGDFYFRTLRPEEAPKYTLVYHLFHGSLGWMTREPVPKWYHVYLKKIGLEPGSEAADVYTRAVLDAAEVIRNNRAKGQGHVDNWDWKAEKLGAIYGRLLVELEAIGTSASVIESFLEGEVLAGTAVGVTYTERQETWFPDIERRRDLFDREFVRSTAVATERLEGGANEEH